MRQILLSLAVLISVSLSACAQNRITASIAVTNATVNGLTFTVNGDTRTWTNNVVNTSTQVGTNADVTGSGSATNLLAAIYQAPFSQIVAHAGGSNSFTLTGNSGLPMSVTASGAYAAISYSTQTVSTLIALQGPVASLPTATARTNVASAIVGASAAIENTNSIPQDSKAASELVGTNGTQTIPGAKTFSNASSIWGGIISQLAGAANVLRGGLWLSGALDSPKFTNAINYGSAFTSPGSSAQSEQFGLGAVASGIQSTAVGSGPTASGLGSTAVGRSAAATASITFAGGNSAVASAQAASAVGAGSSASGTNATAVGANSTANATGAGAFGYAAISGFTNATAIGTLASNTAPNQIMLGAPGISTVVQNNLTVQGAAAVSGNLTVSGVASKITFDNTNNFPAGSDIAFGRYAISSLATGGNSGVLVGTNVFVEVSGPSGAFTINGIAGGRDGKVLVIYNGTGQDCTFANQSGIDPAPANRIICMTGADESTTGNGAATLIYSGSASRWLLISLKQ
jgi:trimeric autotransporter adhesin